MGTWMAYSGRWEQGKALVERAMVLNPRHQRWYHFSFFLDHYRKGEYREALTIVLKMNLPENYMVQAALASTYAQLGEIERAKAALDHVLEVRPSYAEDPRAPFRVRRMPHDLIESIMDGLRAAGLDVPPADQ
jgi:tetratricopeptide (TPR) repeat protein